MFACALNSALIMQLTQRIKFYTKIVLAFVTITSLVLYYKACKNLSVSINLNSQTVAYKNDEFYTNLHTSQVIDETLRLNNFTKRLHKVKINRTFVHNGNISRLGDGKEEIRLAVALCGDRLNQTIITLKSALIFSKKKFLFIVLVDEINYEPLKTKILEWPDKILNRVSLEIHPISFPSGEEGNEWKKLFKLCACQRLFLPSLLQHVDSLLYVDTDVVFIQPVEELWKYFIKMNSSQIAALSPEHEEFATGWYNRFARHPYYEPLGVNSGVMLMNLTRMRKFQWEKYLSPIMKEYKLNIVWGDQDIINIIFHFHPDKLYIFPCSWNFRPDHCMYSSVCPSAKKNGIAIIHGNRGVFHNNKQPAFKLIYEAMTQFDLDGNQPFMFLKYIKTSLKKALNTNCGKHITAIFFSAKSNYSSLPDR